MNRDELQVKLARDNKVFHVPEELQVDMYIAIHWYSQHYHSGMSSDLYMVSCMSEYIPSILCRGIEDESDDSQEFYKGLEEEKWLQ